MKTESNGERNQKFYARIAEEKALAVGMAEKAKEFVATGSEIYHGNVPDGAKENH